MDIDYSLTCVSYPIRRVIAGEEPVDLSPDICRLRRLHHGHRPLPDRPPSLQFPRTELPLHQHSHPEKEMKKSKKLNQSGGSPESRERNSLFQRKKREPPVCRSPSNESIPQQSAPRVPSEETSLSTSHLPPTTSGFRRAASLEADLSLRVSPSSPNRELAGVSRAEAAGMPGSGYTGNACQVVMMSGLSSSSSNSNRDDTVLFAATINQNSEVESLPLRRDMVPSGGRTRGELTPAQRAGTRPQRSTPLCPCFSPNDSDDDETQPIARRNHNTTSGQIMSMARQLRMRIALAQGANNQPPLTTSASIGDGVMMAPPYPVHTQVEYTHYLVPDLLSVTNAPYYWGVMDRFEAEKLLEGKPEGTFLLRDSAQNDYLFSVSFRRYQRTLHARIEQANNRFSFDSYDPGVFGAPTVTQLIDHYKDPAKCLFFEPQLSLPLHRKFTFSLQHLSRATITSHIRYGDIQNLPISKKCKDFLREYHYKQAVRIKNLEK